MVEGIYFLKMLKGLMEIPLFYGNEGQRIVDCGINLHGLLRLHALKIGLDVLHHLPRLVNPSQPYVGMRQVEVAVVVAEFPLDGDIGHQLPVEL